MSRKERLKRGYLKVGELAKKAGVLPSTVRFYTLKGILTVIGKTPGGNTLYDASSSIAKISMVRQLQRSRPSLDELGERLSAVNTK